MNIPFPSKTHPATRKTVIGLLYHTENKKTYLPPSLLTSQTKKTSVLLGKKTIIVLRLNSNMKNFVKF